MLFCFDFFNIKNAVIKKRFIEIEIGKNTKPQPIPPPPEKMIEEDVLIKYTLIITINTATIIFIIFTIFMY